MFCCLSRAWQPHIYFCRYDILLPFFLQKRKIYDTQKGHAEVNIHFAFSTFERKQSEMTLSALFIKE